MMPIGAVNNLVMYPGFILQIISLSLITLVKIKGHDSTSVFKLAHW